MTIAALRDLRTRPRARPRVRRRGAAPAALAAAATLTTVLTGCSGSATGGSGGSGGANDYSFRGATPFGTVIPAAQRKPMGPWQADLISGGTYSLAKYAGKAVVINFWASWCGPCATETPTFARVYDRYKSKGVTFVGVDFKDDKGQARAFIAANHIDFPVVFDDTGKSAIQLGNVPSQGLPFTILLDKQHRVAGAYIGHPMTAGDLDPLLNKVVAGT